MKFIFSLLSASLLWWVMPVTAQSYQKTNFVTLKNNIAEYHQNQLQPIFEAQRNKLNKYLQPEDKADLYTLSLQFKAQQAQKEALIAQKSITDGSQFMKDWEDLQKLEVNILVEVEGLVEKYHDIIQQVLKKDIQTQIKKWQNEINQMTNTYNSKVAYPQQRYFAKYGFGKWSSPAYFLLWKTEKPLVQAAAADMGTEVFPNPVNTEQSLRFYLAEAQAVEVQLLDADGNLKKILVKKDFPAGSHILRIPLQDLSGGLHFYKIISQQEVLIKKIIKE